MSKTNLPDVQATKVKSIPLNRVGISKLDFPIHIKSQSGEKVLCYSMVDLYVSLANHLKGINMSRFSTALMKYKYSSFSSGTICRFLYHLKNRMGSTDSYIEMNFKYFITKKSPKTKLESVLAYNCSFIGHLGSHYRFLLKVEVPVTSVCPCSKQMSLEEGKNYGHGAHNQRGIITVTVEPKMHQIVWIEDLIKLIEGQGSCELYSLLKRPDEKYVTEKAYNNPKFVEDIARDVAYALQGINQLSWFKIKVENEESIHTHNAVCYVERALKSKRWTCSKRSLRTISK